LARGEERWVGTALRSATEGVGTFTAEFDNMAEVTGRLADNVLAQSGREAA